MGRRSDTVDAYIPKTTTRGLAIALTFASLGATACDPSPTDPFHEPLTVSTSDEVPSSATGVPATEVDTLFRSYFSGIRSPRRQVIRSDIELEQAWSEITAPFHPPDPLPVMNFAAVQVLIAAMGERPTSGYGIDVTFLAEADQTIYAVVEEVSPGPSCGRYSVLTQPALVISVPRVGSALTFVEERSVLDCS